jgi:serine/threonine protein kinase
LVASIDRLKQQNSQNGGPKAKFADIELWRGNSMIVLTKDSEGQLTAVKTTAVAGMEDSIRREAKILKLMNHPLVARIHDHCFRTNNKTPIVVTDFMANGSLADHLPDARNREFCQLSSPTRIMRIVAGIVLAMRFVHSQNIIHCDLTPSNVLLDLDWNVKICDFGESVAPNLPQPPPPDDPGGSAFWPDIVSRYLAPERYDNIIVPESDVFSFGMILVTLSSVIRPFRKL